MAFACKQIAVLVVRINNILNNNSAVLTESKAFFSLNTLPHTSVCPTSLIPSVFSVLNILTHMTTMMHVGSLLLLNSHVNVTCQVYYKIIKNIQCSQ